MITCCIRYVVAPGKTAEFEQYARRWIALIAKYGGTHHGYFLPDAQPGLNDGFSFAGLGTSGPRDVAVALYSFPDAAAYRAYRRMAAADDECRSVTAWANEAKPFSSYERTFLRKI
jgi:NIPSNAP protein